ncbi:apolipoprotein N-acyltransferase [Streptomyces longisporoflavus]|uniref:apolipoprotein N-acyltransferase n=1 Tax=Streptomyces longisporoflavus TaxID=28044 RepID=UPI00167E44CD|nr:apolipoprotein N-acyltransferase [Streptomyces longisporoflavus]GGV55872.1 apolipoprotein N-acyltransferase [Streptomyces longisporoflavus]
MDRLSDERGGRRPRLPAAPAKGAGLLASPYGRAALAVAAGALPALAFPAPSLWWFAYVALVPWILLARSADTGRRAALDGWLGGLGFMVAVHHWLLPSLHVFTLLIAALLGLLWAPWGWLVRRLLGGAASPGRTAAALVVLPSGWLLVELVRSWEGLGGPWGLLGSSQWQVEPALRLVSIGGVWLVSALIVMLNTGIAVLLRAATARSSQTSRPSAALAVPATAGLVAVAAVAASAWAWAPRPEPAGRMRVAVVQPGVIDGAGSAGKRLAREEALTRGLAGRDPDLVVWGESSVGYDLAERPDVARRIAGLSREVGADILVNVDARRSDKPGIFKSSVLVGPGGPTGDRYDKMRLVPFGEYIPARSLLGWATSVGKAAGEDRRRGEHPVVMEVEGGLKVGPLVCFESAFPDMSRHLTREGAQLLLAQSSTSSFQSSWAPEQHASLAALRAAETGRPMVHATLTGVSAVYDADGERVGEPLGTSASTAATYDIPLAEGVTPYVRLGDWPVHAALAVLAVLCAAEGVRVLRRPAKARLSRSAAPGPAAPEPHGPRARTAHGSPTRPGR